MDRDGYYMIKSGGEELPWAVDIDAVARAIVTLGEAGWAPSFLLGEPPFPSAIRSSTPPPSAPS